MDFKPNEEQQAFAETAQALFADYCSDEQLRAHDASDAPFMQALWTQCVAGGLHTVVVDEADGGLGLGMTELMAVLERQGRALAPVPLWEQQFGAATVARFGSAAQRDGVVAPLVAGDALLAVSLAGLAQARGPGLNLLRSGDGWRLDGHAAAVPLGQQSRWALLVAAHAGAPRLVLVDLAADKVRSVAGVSQHHQSVADLSFDALALPADAVLAEPALAWLEPRAIACLAALQLGVTAQQLARSVQYLAERRQFERAIGSFQLVAGQMADGHIAVETLRSALWQLVYRIDAGQGVLPQALAVRVQACDAGHRTGHMAQHVHGGMGVDTTFHIHRFLFWSRALAVAQGGSDHHLAKLGDWLADNDTLGWKYDLAEDSAPH